MFVIEVTTFAFYHCLSLAKNKNKGDGRSKIYVSEVMGWLDSSPCHGP
jgi:hypothetical protein